MAATIKAGDNFVRLSWTPVYGVATYNVKRSTVLGGPYATIASGVAWTEYLDESARNGNRYYYVISSGDGSRESVDSTELSAQPLAVPSAPTKLIAAIAKGGQGGAVEMEAVSESGDRLEHRLPFDQRGGLFPDRATQRRDRVARYVSRDGSNLRRHRGELECAAERTFERRDCGCAISSHPTCVGSPRHCVWRSRIRVERDALRLGFAQDVLRTA
jgi:hypothetical protein